MNKIDFTLVELLNTLQAAEGITKGHSSVNNVEKISFSSHFPWKKESENRRKCQVTQTKFLIDLETLEKGRKRMI